MVDLRKNAMNQFAKATVSKAKESLGIESTNGSVDQQQGPINWQNYNYPPLIRIVHYSTDQLRQPHLGIAKKMHACALLILANQLFNLLNCIIEAAVDCPEISNIIVLYSVLNVGILTFAAMLSFTNGFYALCQGPSHGRRLWVYRITQAVLCVLWFIFSIIGAGPFDGWVKFGVLSSCSLGFSIFLGVVQNIIYMIACGLGIYNIVALGRAYGESPFINEPVSNNTNEDMNKESNGGFGLQGFGKKVLGGFRNGARDDDQI